MALGRQDSAHPALPISREIETDKRAFHASSELTTSGIWMQKRCVMKYTFILGLRKFTLALSLLVLSLCVAAAAEKGDASLKKKPAQTRASKGEDKAPNPKPHLHKKKDAYKISIHLRDETKKEQTKFKIGVWILDAQNVKEDATSHDLVIPQLKRATNVTVTVDGTATDEVVVGKGNDVIEGRLLVTPQEAGQTLLVKVTEVTDDAEKAVGFVILAVESEDKLPVSSPIGVGGR